MSPIKAETPFQVYRARALYQSLESNQEMLAPVLDNLDLRQSVKSVIPKSEVFFLQQTFFFFLLSLLIVLLICDMTDVD